MGGFPYNAFPGLTREELERAQAISSGRAPPIMLDPTVIQANPQASQPYPTQGPLAIDPRLLAQASQESLGTAPVAQIPGLEQRGGSVRDQYNPQRGQFLAAGAGAFPYKKYGAIEPGNLDLTHRPHVPNGNGVSTILSMSFRDGKNGPEVLIPMVSDDGRIMTSDEAIAEYDRTGKHLGKYRTPEEATAAAKAIHDQQEQFPPINTLRTGAARAQMPAGDWRVNIGDAQQIDPVQAATAKLGGGGNLAAVHARQRELAQQQIDLAQQGGEIASQGAAREAQKYKELGDITGPRADRMAQQLDEYHATRRQTMSQLRGTMEAMRYQLGQAPSTTKAELLGLAAGVISAGASHSGKGGGAAALAQGLSGFMMRDYARWEQGIQGYEKQTDMLRKIMSAEDGSMESALAAEQQLGSLYTAHTLNAIKQIGAETKSMEAKRAFEEMANDVESKWLAHQEDLYTKAEALGEQYYAMPLNDLRSGMESGQIGALGHQVYAKRLEIEQKEATLAKTRAEDKLGAPGTEILPGYFATKQIPAQAVNDLNKKAMLGQDIKSDFERLAAIRKRHQGNIFSRIDTPEHRTDVTEVARIRSSLVGKLTNFYGKGAPQKFENDAELKTLMDPTATVWPWQADPSDVYKRYAQGIDESLDVDARAVGAERRGGSPAAPAAPQGTGGTIRVQGPGGKTLELPDTPEMRAQVAQRNLKTLP